MRSEVIANLIIISCLVPVILWLSARWAARYCTKDTRGWVSKPPVNHNGIDEDGELTMGAWE